MKKKQAVIMSLLFEAYRRNDMGDGHELAKPLTQRWLGLGTAAAYRPALEAGLMRFINDYTPPRRCMGWLCLTEARVTAMEAQREIFQKSLDALKSDPRYRHSYLANYMLVGGMSASH